MDMEKVLESLEEAIIREIDKVAHKGDMTPVEIKNVSDAVCLLESIKKIKDDDDDEYDERDGGHSERSAGIRMNRYSRSYNRSYDRGYSRHSINDRIVDKLERMMDEAGSEYERDVILNWIDKVKSE